MHKIFRSSSLYLQWWVCNMPICSNPSPLPPLSPLSYNDILNYSKTLLSLRFQWCYFQRIQRLWINLFFWKISKFLEWQWHAFENILLLRFKIIKGWKWINMIHFHPVKHSIFRILENKLIKHLYVVSNWYMTVKLVLKYSIIRNKAKFHIINKQNYKYI